MPSPILMIAACFSLFLSTILACFWPDGDTDGIYVMGLANREPKSLAVWVWMYCIVWWFVQDFCKVAIYAIMEKYNIFGINDYMMDDDELDEGEKTGEEDSLLPNERGLKEKLISSSV